MSQNPSQLVAPQLQNHVHLISRHRYPHLPSLNIEQAFRYLIEAPSVVKTAHPMSWEYVHPPPDGTAWLEWIPARPNQSGGSEYRFPSDGYIWADPEYTHRQDFGGYTIEWMSHQLGYKPGVEPMATHARTRFHFVQKNPGVNAAMPEPSLWIVHYHQAAQGRMLPVDQINISPQMRQVAQERRWLEMQGRLDRREFMLHDRQSWPSITVPTGGPASGAGQMQQQQQHPGMYQNHMMQQQMAAAAGGGVPRFPQHQPSFSNASSQGPPPKRPRTSGPSGMPGAVEHDSSIEEEEAQLLDYFDHLTPRDISYARYIQHHRWMEEVFSSPYSTSSIVPPDLGLGLMGELKGLTDGILNPPSVDDVRADVRLDPNPYKRDKDQDRDGKERAWRAWDDKPPNAKEAQAFTNLSKEQVEEFNKRVEKHLSDGQAEIERMKREHAEKMAEWKKTKTLMQAEKRLRYATWEGHEDAVQPVYRLDVPPVTNGHVEEGSRQESVEDVVKDVEKLLGVRVQAYKDATIVQKGGLEREEEVDQDDEKQEDEMQGLNTEPQQPSLRTGANGGINGMMQQQQQQPTVPPPQPQAPGISVNDPSALQQQQADRAQSAAQAEAAAAATAQQHPPMLDNLVGQNDQPFNDMTNMDQMDDTIGDTSLMDMDMDMGGDTGDIDFVQHDADEFDDSLAGTPAQAAMASPVPPIAEPQPDQPLVPPADETQVDTAALEDEEDLFGEVGNGDQLGGVDVAPEEASLREPAAGAVEMPVQAEESAIPAIEADASLGTEPDASAIPTSNVQATTLAIEPGTAAGPPPPLSEQPAAPAAMQQSEVSVPAPGIEPAFDATATATADAGVFDDGTFDDLPDMGGVGADDDGLIDFGGGMEGLDDSAFGDAFHGMDPAGGQGTPGAGEGGS